MPDEDAHIVDEIEIDDEAEVDNADADIVDEIEIDDEAEVDNADADIVDEIEIDDEAETDEDQDQDQDLELDSDVDLELDEKALEDDVPVGIPNLPVGDGKVTRPDGFTQHANIYVECEVNGETERVELNMLNAASNFAPADYNAMHILKVLVAHIKRYSSSVEVVVSEDEDDEDDDA